MDSRWRVRGPFSTLELELDPARSDASSRDASLRHARELAFAARSSDREVARVLREVLARLGGTSPRAARAEDVTEEILFAVRAGLLAVRPLPVRTVVVTLGPVEDDALGPEPEPTGSRSSWSTRTDTRCPGRRTGSNVTAA
jgi:hypothetical protein